MTENERYKWYIKNRSKMNVFVATAWFFYLNSVYGHGKDTRQWKP